MDAFDTILTHLHAELEKANGNKAELLRKLGTPQSRMTLYRALDPDVPTLPQGDVLCRWLDAMGLQVLRPLPPTPTGAGDVYAVRLADVSDILQPLENWPDRGTMTLPVALLDARGLDPVALAAVVVRHGMPPTILPGDLAILDVSDGAQITPVDGAIHVLNFSGQPYLRRVQRTPQGWLLSSDTHGIMPVTIADGETWPGAIHARLVGVLHLP